MNRSTKRLIPLFSFTGAYLLTATIAAIAKGNSEFVFYLVVMAILVAAITLIHRIANLSLPLLWCLSIWGLLHMAGGLVPVPESWPISGDKRVLYSWWLIPGMLKYDQVVHAFGFGVTTWLCWQGMCASFRRVGGTTAPVRPTFGRMVLCAAAGMGFGAANEVVEFAATLLMPDTNVGGYQNTGWDLVSNMIGTIIAATAIYFFEPSRRESGEN
ncbi:MAG: hypothetical protein AB7N71_05335 [Phycisphaerae bacterium]